MLRMRNKGMDAEGILSWLCGAWHLYYQEHGRLKEWPIKEAVSQYEDDLIDVLDNLSYYEWEVIG